MKYRSYDVMQIKMEAKPSDFYAAVRNCYSPNEPNRKSLCRLYRRQKVDTGACLFILVSATLLTCGFSVRHLFSNQLVYYLPYLSYFYQENFAADRLCQTGLTHPMFGFVTIAMGHFLSLGQISLVGAFACWAAISGGIYFILKRLYPEHILANLIAGLFALMTLGIPALGGHHVGSSDVWNSMFEPFFLASAVSILGIGLLIDEKYSSAGVALGFGSLLHPHIFLFVVPLLLLFSIIRRDLHGKILMQLLVPVAVAGIPSVLNILASVQPFHRGDVQMPSWQIEADIRASHHAHVWSWLQWGNAELRRYIGVLLVEVGAWGLSRPLPRPTSTLALAIGTLGSIFLPAVALTVILHSSYLGRFQLAHLAPLIPLLGLAFVAGAYSQFAMLEGPKISGWRLIGLLILMIAGFVLAMETKIGMKSLWLFVFFALAATLSIARIFSGLPRLRKWLSACLIIGPIIIMLIFSVIGYRHSDMACQTKDVTTDFALWVRVNTPKDELFLTPPDLAGFRSWALRSIVVDFKGFVHNSRYVEEWYSRICDVSGLKRPSNLKEALNGYLLLDGRLVKQLGKKYGFRYFVAYRNAHKGNLQDLSLIYEGSKFMLYYVPES